jgi:hypothetical protein
MKIPVEHYRRLLILFILLLVWNKGIGQLKLAPVQNPKMDGLNFSARILETDTISLPVWDDFSYGGGLPNPEIWINSTGVFINYSLGINPPSMGVATFDGASSNAGIYDANQFAIGKADSLVSKPIDLGSLSSEEINSVYLSFFWQFFGYPEIPDQEDSLRLLFKNQQNLWEVIDVFDRDKAISNDTFQQVIYKVEPQFLHTAFQFKLENTARLSGPYDSWHIDYIYLDKGRSITDQSYLDRAIATRPDYIFKGYSAMPMDQFRTDPDKFILPSKVDIYNLDELLQPIEYTAIIRNTHDENQIFDTLNFNTEVNPVLQGLQRRTLTTNELDISRLDLDSDSIYLTMDFYISSGDSISDSGINYRINDTTSYNFVLDNYFATDDGTAEFGLGMEQRDAQLAYMFVVDEPDVLNRVDIHFPNIGRIQAGTAFNLRIWRRLTDNPDDLLFERSDMAINPITDFNEFQSIRLSDIYVTDTFYIGYEQMTNAFMAVGFDKQHDSGDRIYFNVSGGWIPNEEFEGSLMIRPYFGDAEPTRLPDEAISAIRIYPNPTDGMIRLEGKIGHITIYNLIGESMMFKKGSGMNMELDLSHFDEGLYILQGYSDGHSFNKKILIRR